MAQAPSLTAAYLKKRADLVRFFTVRTGSAAAAEDVVQEIWLKLSTTEAPDDLRSPEAYLYRIGSNVLLDRRRHDRRQAAREAGWALVAAGPGPDPAAEEPPPDQAIAARQRLAAVLSALDDLPPKAAHAFRLHKLEGLSHAEVAQRMGVSRSAVEKYMIAALRHLAGRVGE